MIFTCLSMGSAFGQSKQVPCDSEKLQILLDKVFTYSKAKKYDLSIAKSLELIEQAESLNCNSFLFNAYNQLSINYIDLRDTIPSLRYAKKALYYAQQTGDDVLLSTAYNNLAAFFTYDKSKQQKALNYFKKSLVLARKVRDSSFLNPALNIAELYRNMDRFEDMPAYLREAEGSLNEKNIKYDDPRIYLDVLWGDYYSHSGKQYEGLKYYESAYQGIVKDSIRILALDFFDKYADSLKVAGNFEKAYEVQKKLRFFEREASKVEAEESLLIAKARAETAEYKRQRNEAELHQQLADQDLRRKFL